MSSNINNNQNSEIDIFGFIDTIFRNKFLLLFFLSIFILIGWVFNIMPGPEQRKITITISELEVEQEIELEMLNLELHQLLKHNDESEFYKFTNSSAPSAKELSISINETGKIVEHISTDYLFEQLYKIINQKEFITSLVHQSINQEENNLNHNYSYQEIESFFNSLNKFRRVEPLSDNRNKTIIETSFMTSEDYNEILQKNYIYETSIKLATQIVKTNLHNKIATIVRSVERKIDFQIQTLKEYNDILLSKFSQSENSLNTTSLIDFYNNVIRENPEIIYDDQNDFLFIPEIKLNREIDKYYETLLLINKMENKSSIKNFNSFHLTNPYLNDNFYAINYNHFDFRSVEDINRGNSLYRLPVHPLIFFPVIGLFISLFFIFFIDGYRKYNKKKMIKEI